MAGKVTGAGPRLPGVRPVCLVVARRLFTLAYYALRSENGCRSGTVVWLRTKLVITGNLNGEKA